MSRYLSELAVTNFRSIKGTVVVPLDAPIILIHGPNGAGKTSIATALELALTGDVAGLRRSDENVQEHLVNRGADNAEVQLRVKGGVPSESKVTVRAGKIDGRGLLNADSRTFFTDRCYLSQSTLGRLLDIYQSPTSRDPANTPLTNFVKSILGLDALDALIDGLNPAGHKARMLRLSADFARADQLATRLQAEQREIDSAVAGDRAEAERLEARFAQLRDELRLPSDLPAARQALDEGYDSELLSHLEARVNGVTSLQLQWSSLTSENRHEDLAGLEAREADAAKALENYRGGPGKRLSAAITSLRPIFPDIGDPEQIDPEEARVGAFALVSRETDITVHQQRLALLRPALVELQNLTGAAAEAKAVRDRQTLAATQLAQSRLRDSTATKIRASLAGLAHTIGVPDIADSETTQDVLDRLLTTTQAELASAKKRTESRLEASEIVARLSALHKTRDIRNQDASANAERRARLAAAQRVVSQERNMANSLRNAATDARSAIVGQVFNERLNAIWRDLFVRLAPNEPFVPAFVLPGKEGAGVTALLETVHREGGFYGRPGAMLSAGNLNTAALTLFLSLHLSVKPDLPWLILDDPVQSMDELHVAQFAALLRTLAKREDRQIVIAIHERQLFDYLTLELSPAFHGDRLITVEIGKSAEGNTRYETKVLSYEPDRLVA